MRLDSCKRLRTVVRRPSQSRLVRPVAWAFCISCFAAQLLTRRSNDTFVAAPYSPTDSRRLRVDRALRGCASPASGDKVTAAVPVPLPAARHSLLIQLWGVLGVAIYLSYGVKKVVPIVRNGITAITEVWQWGLLAATLAFFAYVEGYKGFQRGFCPRVVARAWVVSEVNRSGSATEFFKLYGSAYVATSIMLSLISYSAFYMLVSNGINVAEALATIGLKAKGTEYVGTAALAYAFHMAALPIRVPITVLLTRVVAGWMGKDVSASDRAMLESRMLPLWHKALAPAFCIGYFHGTRKRVISSWLVTATIFCVVVGVKRLGNPYRAIIDAGVIVGLLWGSISVILLFARSRIRGRPPDYDPSLPKGTPYETYT